MKTANDILSNITLKSTYMEQKEEIINGKRYFLDKWKVVLKYNGRQLSTPYVQGIAWNGAEPKLSDVLHSLLSDLGSIRLTEDMYDFAKQFSYRTEEKKDLEKTRRLYDSMERQAKKVERFFQQDEIKELYEFFENY